MASEEEVVAAVGLNDRSQGDEPCGISMIKKVPQITNVHISPDTTCLENDAVRDGEQSDRIHVVVDSSKVARCRWCGTMESAYWPHSEGGTFCSSKCAHAAMVPEHIGRYALAAIISLCVLLMAAPKNLGLALSSSLSLLILTSPLLISAIQGMSHRRSVPRDSRRTEIPLDTALLRTVSTSVACPRCDAEPDLRRIGKDRVYACGYCGATGTVVVIDKSNQRGSDHTAGR